MRWMGLMMMLLKCLSGNDSRGEGLFEMCAKRERRM